MISTEHRKHPKLARPSLGNFGRQEWAILGAPCNQIQQLAKEVIKHLSDRYRCAYIDAKHLQPEAQPEWPEMLAAGAFIEGTDVEQYQQWVQKGAWNVFQNRNLLNGCDVVLVNGNHHEAAAQVVIIDAAKAASLQRRINQLTNVRLILLTDEKTPVFDFLNHTLPGLQQIPTLPLQDLAGIQRFFDQEMQLARPLINGLVLAGGRSLRMGQDKGAINWHGKPQREYVADLLQPVCNEVFISCRPEQQHDLQGDYPTLPDSFTGLGPFGAILSAFRSQPDRAWLVTACDLPLLDRNTLDFLVEHRSVQKIATTYQSPEDALPEPLITIWEPKSYAVLLSFLAQGYSCPRKVLINAAVQILTAPDPAALQNVNTPEEMEKLKSAHS